MSASEQMRAMLDQLMGTARNGLSNNLLLNNMFVAFLPFDKRLCCLNRVNFDAAMAVQIIYDTAKEENRSEKEREMRARKDSSYKICLFFVIVCLSFSTGDSFSHPVANLNKIFHWVLVHRKAVTMALSSKIQVFANLFL